MANNKGPNTLIKEVVEKWNALSPEEKARLSKDLLKNFTTQEDSFTDGLPGNFDKFIRERIARSRQESCLGLQ